MKVGRVSRTLRYLSSGGTRNCQQSLDLGILGGKPCPHSACRTQCTCPVLGAFSPAISVGRVQCVQVLSCAGSVLFLLPEIQFVGSQISPSRSLSVSECEEGASGLSVGQAV